MRVTTCLRACTAEISVMSKPKPLNPNNSKEAAALEWLEVDPLARKKRQLASAPQSRRGEGCHSRQEHDRDRTRYCHGHQINQKKL